MGAHTLCVRTTYRLASFVLTICYIFVARCIINARFVIVAEHFFRHVCQRSVMAVSFIIEHNWVNCYYHFIDIVYALVGVCAVTAHIGPAQIRIAASLFAVRGALTARLMLGLPAHFVIVAFNLDFH